MKRIEIVDGNTKAALMPDYGGMISSFSVDGVEILRMNEDSLGIANCLAVRERSV